MRRRVNTVTGMIILLLLALVSEDKALSSPAWPNEPPGFTVLSDWNWSALNGGGWQTGDIHDAFVTSDATAPLSPALVVQDRFIDAGNVNGGGSNKFLFPSPAGIREGYFGVKWKLSNPFVPYGSCLEKGFTTQFGDYVQVVGALWVGIEGCDSNNLTIGGAIAFNNYFPIVDNCHLPNIFGGNPCAGGTVTLHGNVVTPPGCTQSSTCSSWIQPGVWHTVEFYFKWSTCTTCRDGTIRQWIDGIQTMDYSPARGAGVNFPQNQFFWSAAEITPAWGSPDSGTADKSHFWDHVHLSAGTGAAPADSTPPAAPTGLRVL